MVATSLWRVILLCLVGVSLSAGSGFLSTQCESWLSNLDDFPLGLQFHTAFAVIYTRSPDRDLLLQSVSPSVAFRCIHVVNYPMLKHFKRSTLFWTTLILPTPILESIPQCY